MSVKFFGQFLIERGEIDAGDLRGALDLMEEENAPLGEIALRRGLLSQDDVGRINRAQRGNDRPFGELAVDLGLLDAGQLEEVVRAQQEARLLLGEALVRLGRVDTQRLPLLLDAFKIDQAPYQGDAVELPPELEGNPMASCILGIFPKLCMRVAQLRVKAGRGQPLSQLASLQLTRGAEILGPPGLAVAVVCDRDFAARIAVGMSGLALESIDEETALDGLGEFLNVLAGSVVCLLEREGVEVRLSLRLGDAVLADGTAFELAVGEGAAALVLADR